MKAESGKASCFGNGKNGHDFFCSRVIYTENHDQVGPNVVRALRCPLPARQWGFQAARPAILNGRNGRQWFVSQGETFNRSWRNLAVWRLDGFN